MTLTPYLTTKIGLTAEGGETAATSLGTKFHSFWLGQQVAHDLSAATAAVPHIAIERLGFLLFLGLQEHFVSADIRRLYRDARILLLEQGGRGQPLWTCWHRQRLSLPSWRLLRSPPNPAWRGRTGRVPLPSAICRHRRPLRLSARQSAWARLSPWEHRLAWAQPSAGARRLRPVPAKRRWRAAPGELLWPEPVRESAAHRLPQTR